MFQGFVWNVNSFDQEGVQLGKGTLQSAYWPMKQTERFRFTASFEHLIKQKKKYTCEEKTVRYTDSISEGAGLVWGFHSCLSRKDGLQI